MVVRFQVVAPATKRRTFTVRLPILLGRGEHAKFRIQHDKVSRRHCELFERGGHVYVRDLGSTNGTFLDEEQVPVSTKTRVPPGGVVRVGVLSFAVEYQPDEPHPASAELGSAKVGDEHPHAADSDVEESRVETNEAPTEEHLDFKVEHADDEPVGVSSDADELAAASVNRATAEASSLDVAAPADTGAKSGDDTSRVPEAADPPAAAGESANGFDFLSSGESADSAAGPSSWPAPADDAADDGPDDDQLNAFFKGLK